MHRDVSYFTSAPFKFIVEGQAFFAHSALISRLSEPLDRLINLEMKEKQQGYAVLEDVTAATFDRFLEWASKGYYTPPPPSIDPESEEIVEDKSKRQPEEPIPAEAVIERAGFRFQPVAAEVDIRPEPRGTEDEGFGTSSGSKKKKKKVFSWEEDEPTFERRENKDESTSKRRENMRESFHRRQPVVRRGHINLAPPRKNLNKSENYTETFLCHARLYVFADLQDIPELKSLALDDLHALLAIFDLYQERTGDIVSLLRFAYANTAPGLLKGSLRGVLTDFVGVEMDVLMLDNEFREAMIENGGDMLEDFMSVVMKRIRP